MKRLILICISLILTISYVYAKDFVLLTEVKLEVIENHFFKSSKYKYYGEKVLIDKALISEVSLCQYAENLKITEIHKKGENIYVYETPEEVYRLLKE